LLSRKDDAIVEIDLPTPSTAVTARAEGRKHPSPPQTKRQRDHPHSATPAAGWELEKGGSGHAVLGGDNAISASNRETRRLRQS